MRVLSDIVPLQIQPTRHRGIGQYTAGVLHALLTSAEAGESHILWGNGHLAPPRGCAKDVANSRCRLYYGDYPLYQYHPDQWSDQLDAYAAYWQAQLKRFEPDILHIHSPFEWDAPLHSHHRNVRTVLTVYDLIPLRLEEHYLRTAPLWMKDGYRHVCRLIEQCEHIVSISEQTRRDLIELLHVNPERIHVAPPGPSNLASCPADPQLEDRLRDRFALHDGFVLSTLGFDYRKNILRALASYARLGPELRASFPLVVVCQLGADEERDLRRASTDLHIDSQVVFTNYLPDRELASFYRMATVQFFPSIYEGFGIPVLDAMLFGLPVITSNVSALPEVAGDAAVLVNPLDEDEMAGALTRVLQSDSLRAQMRGRGLEQAARFRWEETAEIVRQVYAAAHANGVHNRPGASLRPSPRLRHLGLVSPLPPQYSGVADYSADMLRALRKLVPVTAFVPPELLSAVRQHIDGPVLNIEQLPGLVCKGDVDAVLYEVGNSAFHHFQLPYLSAVPGVVELHDGTLHGLIYSLTLKKGDSQGYLHELSYAHDLLGREHAADVVEGRAQPGLYELTVNRRCVNDAVGMIVHNQWTATSVYAHGTGLPVEMIPHPVTRSESAAYLDRQAARAALGIPAEALVLATFGRLAPSKRLDVIANAFARLLREVPQARLYWIGELELETDAFKLPGLLQELGIAEATHITGYAERSRFVQYMAATDIGLNLRYPSAGETSGTLVRLLSAGIPTITSNIGAFAEIPDDCCWKVDVDDLEEELLLRYLRRLATDLPLRLAMSANARSFAEANLPDWDQAARQILEFVERALVDQSGLLPRAQSETDKVTGPFLSRYSPVRASGVLRSARRYWQLLTGK